MTYPVPGLMLPEAAKKVSQTALAKCKAHFSWFLWPLLISYSHHG